MHYAKSGSVSTRIDIVPCNFTKFWWSCSGNIPRKL